MRSPNEAIQACVPWWSIDSIREGSIGCRFSQPLRQKPHHPWREEAAMAAGLLDWIAEPIVAGARHDAAAGEKSGLLERPQEGVGMRLAVDQIVLGAAAEQHRGLVVGIGGAIDRRRIEIE